MKKTLLKELILPSFWLFFFIVSPESEVKTQLKKQDDTELKKQENIFAASEPDTGKKMKFTKAVFLPGF